MDPQQRLLLEVAWEALEDAGQVQEQLAGTRTGVFIGISGSEYASLQLNHPGLISAYATTGGALSIAANRLSYFFDFRGPSMVVDTACSSSLVAVHLACRSLWSGESTLALVGGANLLLSPAITVSFSQAGATSPDGRCKAFDAQANGIVRGEGVGIVVLKTLSQALADGEPIYAVIRGSAVAQDGKSNGLTAPNLLAQETVLRQAYHAAGVAPSLVQYIEAHGTGTLLGDPIEAEALGRVLAVDRAADRPCAIGSVKTNIGHLEAAAGIASLIKVALAIKYRAIPPSLHFREPNPHIPFESLGLRVQQAFGKWPDEGRPALAGVSAFGFGGTNAHVVLEEPPKNSIAAPPSEDEGSEQLSLLPLSAHSPEALQSLAQSYLEFLSSNIPDQSISLKNICYTASVRRHHHDRRLALVAHSREEMMERLAAFLKRGTRHKLAPLQTIVGQRRKLVFVFSGYGGQWWGMGRELLKHEPVFRAALAQCDELLQQYVEWSLLEELIADEARSQLDGSHVEITQIALFGLQIAVAALWRSWGVEPDAVVGHSLGEVAAAHVAGILSLPDAVRVIFHRSRIMQQSLEQQEEPGGMAAVDLSIEEARQLLAGYADRLSVAGHNSPRSVVLAGATAALEEVLQTLSLRGVKARVLAAPGAGHSPQAAVAQEQLEQALKGLQPQPATTPFFSTVTGSSGERPTFDAVYWGRNVRDTVLFSEVIERLDQEGYDMFLELGPQPILLPEIMQCLSHHKDRVTLLPSLRRKREDRTVMLGSLGHLYTQGYSVDWRRLYPQPGQCVKLPLYTWQRERYWIEDKGGRNGSGLKNLMNARHEPPLHPFLDQHVRSAIERGTHFWQMNLGPDIRPQLATRRLQGKLFLSAAAYIETALAAATEAFGNGRHVLENLNFSEPLIFPEDDALSPTMQLVINTEISGAASFRFFSLNAGATPQQELWTLRAQGKIRLVDQGAPRL